jgi:hypothetical protein
LHSRWSQNRRVSLSDCALSHSISAGQSGTNVGRWGNTTCNSSGFGFGTTYSGADVGGATLVTASGCGGWLRRRFLSWTFGGGSDGAGAWISRNPVLNSTPRCWNVPRVSLYPRT